MAQSQPFLVRLQPFYGWYIQVSGQLRKTNRKRGKLKTEQSKRTKFKKK
jgi:hypothetical protein